MNPLDALTLARTKLRSHRIRTGITVMMAGLFFGLIMAAIIIIQGVFSSIDAYSDVGLNNRTILMISPMQSAQAVFSPYDHLDDDTFIKEVEAAHAVMVAKKQAAAKKYSVPYTPAIDDPSPVVIDPVSKKKVFSNEGTGSTAFHEAAWARQNTTDTSFSLTRYLEPYKSAVSRGRFERVRPVDGSLAYMKDGKENQKALNTSRGEFTGDQGGMSLTIIDGSITKPFLSSTQFQPEKGEIPVILPFSDAEKLLGLEKLPATATPEVRRERLEHVRRQVHTVTASFCYRNYASQALLSHALMQQDTLKQLKPGEPQPSIIYNPPHATDCTGVTVKSDTRSGAEKKADENRMLFEKEVGMWIGTPSERRVVVRGVGISGDVDMGTMALSPATFVVGLLNSNLGYNTWAVPQDLLEALPKENRPQAIFGSESEVASAKDAERYDFEQHLVEFGDQDEARALLKKTGAYTGSSSDVAAFQFGSGTLFIDEARDWTERILFWALLVVGSIAAITLWGVIGRTIADSRRESAVFRAIGATRLDIASMYGLYAFLLSLRVAAFAFLLGLVVAFGVDFVYSEGTTVAAQLAYAATDTGIVFRLYNVFTWYVPVILGIIILVGLLASVVPIALGVRRNPITDMRDDG